MAFFRLASLKSLQQGVLLVSPSSLSSQSSQAQKQIRWSSELLKRLSTTSSAAGEEKSEGRGGRGEVAVSNDQEGGKKSKLFPMRRRKRSLWRNDDRHDFVPALWEYFPSGLGNALTQASDSINRLFDSLAPSQLMGRFKKKDECYKLRFEVPGLSKEDLKITVEDGILTIEGQHKEDDDDDDDDDEGSSDHHDEYYWSSIYGYYNTTLVLPEDAIVDEIKAELKDGVLYITIPRTTDKPNKDVKQVPIH